VFISTHVTIATFRVNVRWKREGDCAVCLTVGMRMNSEWMKNAECNYMCTVTNFMAHALVAGLLRILLVWNSFIIKAPPMDSIW
jgi:hypothetical protein